MGVVLRLYATHTHSHKHKFFFINIVVCTARAALNQFGALSRDRSPPLENKSEKKMAHTATLHFDGFAFVVCALLLLRFSFELARAFVGRPCVCVCV